LRGGPSSASTVPSRAPGCLPAAAVVRERGAGGLARCGQILARHRRRTRVPKTRGAPVTAALDAVVIGNVAAAAEAVIPFASGGFRGRVDLFADRDLPGAAACWGVLSRRRPVAERLLPVRRHRFRRETRRGGALRHARGVAGAGGTLADDRRPPRGPAHPRPSRRVHVHRRARASRRRRRCPHRSPAASSTWGSSSSPPAGRSRRRTR
jgi:hypothetical protein